MDFPLRLLSGCLGLIVAAGLAGCGSGGDGLPRQAVSGTVKLGGEPLAQGRIEFDPTAPETSVPAGGEIKDGSFAIPRHEGPIPGDYRVMITSSVPIKAGRETAPGAEPPRGGKPMASQSGPAPELVPKQYNSRTTLTAKVEADKTNTFEFDLKK